MARKKIYKIKHYKTGYRRKRSAFKKALFGLLIIGAVFAASFLIVGPVLDAMYNKTVEPDTSSASSVPSSTVSSDIEIDESEAPTVSSVYKLYRITEEELTLTEKHAELVAKIADEGYTAVIMPIRTNRNIYFETKNDLALRTKSVVDVKMTELIKALKEKGIKTYGEFSVFMDYEVPRLKYGTDQISMGIQFKSDLTKLFKDSVNDPNGTFWLSPDSDLTEEYVISLAQDVNALGLDCVVLKYFYYVNNPNAYFADGVNRAENLKEILNSLKNAFGETEVTVETDMLAVTEGKAEELGGKITDFSSEIFLSLETIDEATFTTLKSLTDTTVTVSTKDLTEEDKKALQEIGGFVVLVG